MVGDCGLVYLLLLKIAHNHYYFIKSFSVISSISVVLCLLAD